MTRPDHIFIVGLSRTGTTLTRNILNCSCEIGIGGESHFLGDTRRLGLVRRSGFRQRLAAIGDLATDEGVHKIVDYIYSIREHNFWSRLARNVERAEFTRRLLESDRSEQALLDVAMGCYAGGKPVRGEKTPAHIYAVPTLLEWFPNARVIHTFRDPRAVYLSNKRKYEKRKLPWASALLRRARLPFELYASLDVMLNWFRVIQLHRRYQQRYPGRYYLSKYEDLVSDPQASLQKLCDFLGVPFTEAMLQQSVPNSSYMPRHQVQGFDSAAIDRWRKHLDPLVNRWFVLWCKKQLLEFGYQP
jgi:hypothetical protein